MSHETERRADRYLLSDDESQIIFDRLIAGRRFAHLAPVDHPAVHFFGGQPGAGKSSIQDSTVEQLRSADGYDTVAQVIGDELRAYHPMYDSLLSSGGEDAPFYTDRDSGRWVEQSIDFVLGRRLHLVLEGTLRQPEVTLSTAALSAECGYAAHLHVVAAHEFISRSRIFQRDVGQIAQKGRGRYTVPEAHDRAYQALPSSLDVLARSGRFASITLYDANGQSIAVVDGTDPNGPEQLHVALGHERDLSRLDIAQVLGDIDRSAEQLRSLDRRGRFPQPGSARREHRRAA